MKTFIKYLKSLFAPAPLATQETHSGGDVPSVAVVIPTYNPSPILKSLAHEFLDYYPNMQVVVVDDCTPEDIANETLRELSDEATKINKLHSIRTPHNKMKAGAINHGLLYIKDTNMMPDFIITCDDDVRINEKTVQAMVNTLMSNSSLGAVCSLARVSNKNANLLTRLQGLEYHGFNLGKIADNGFFQGPLVMQGMLVAFRREALEQAEGFAENHLIEDYEITAKIKTLGWHVGVAQEAEAWTEAPTKYSQLWRQRIRWTTGGIQVVTHYHKYLPSVIQDLIGHLMFVTLLILITLSLLIPLDGSNPGLVIWLISIALAQFGIGFMFHIFTLITYKDADMWDWVLRLSLIPEFIYSNILTTLLVGAYLFSLYRWTFGKLEKTVPAVNKFYNQGIKLFLHFGFSEKWGTR